MKTTPQQDRDPAGARKGRVLVIDDDIRAHLMRAATIAVVGLSPKPERDSHRVARYLQAAGYQIVPVRPAQKMLLGEPVVASLDDLDAPVDVVNVFRNPAQVPAIARQALRLKPRLFWMQKGIVSPEAAALLTHAGIDVIMDRCIKQDHERYCQTC